MALHKNVWSPDTCGCQIVYEWDDSVPEDERISTAIESCMSHDGKEIFTIKCPIHNHHTNKDEHYADVLSENNSKNIAIGLLIKTIGKLDGGAGDVKWRFDDNRNVILSHPMLTQNDKDDMNALDKKGIYKLTKQVTIE